MKNKMLFVILVLAMFTLAACGGQTSSTGASNPPANTAAPVATSAPQTAASPAPVSKNAVFDPALVTDAALKSAISHVYEGLVTLDSTGQPVIALAGNITVSEDGLDYIFSLRPGVTFHDGTSLDADAVVTNFSRWFDPQDPMHGAGTYDAWVASFGGFKSELTSDNKPKSEVDGIQKQDTMTVLIHLNMPDADFLKKLADPAFSIASPAALKAAGFGTSSGTDGGSGPYKLGTWSASGVTLEPFTGYWNPSLVPTSNMQISFSQ